MRHTVGVLYMQEIMHNELSSLTDILDKILL